MRSSCCSSVTIGEGKRILTLFDAWNCCFLARYMGKKFNSKKENAHGEKYMGIQIIRFYIKCGTCSNQMTFKTDPQNDDYQMESGGTRTFEIWKEQNAIADANRKARIDEDKDDAMTALENRTRDSQKAVDMLDALDELKAVSQRNERIDNDTVLAAAQQRRTQKETQLLDQDDEELIKSIRFGSSGKSSRRRGDGSTAQGESGPRRAESSDKASVIDDLNSRKAKKAAGGSARAAKKKGKKRRKLEKLKLRQLQQYDDVDRSVGDADFGRDSSSNDDEDKYINSDDSNDMPTAEAGEPLSLVADPIKYTAPNARPAVAASGAEPPDKSMPRAEAGMSDLLGAKIRERTAGETRAQETMTLPLLFKRKRKQPAKSADSSAAIAKETTAVVNGSQESGGRSEGGGLLGLAGYGSSSGEDG